MSWPVVEAALHRWVRESTGLDATSVTWPANGRPLLNPPAASLSVIGDRDFTIPGLGQKRSAQHVEWLVTVTAGPGTHSLDLFTQADPDAVATATVTMPGGSTIAAARTALLAAATSAFSDLTVASSGTNAIRITGTADLSSFHLEPSGTLSLELVEGPVQVLRTTAGETVVSIEFRSTATSGAGTARLLATAAKDGMRDFDRMLRRCGYRFGAVLRDTPSYTPDLTESRHILDVQLLGHRVTVRGPKPWVRATRTTLTAADNTLVVITPE